MHIEPMSNSVTPSSSCDDDEQNLKRHITPAYIRKQRSALIKKVKESNIQQQKVVDEIGDHLDTIGEMLSEMNEIRKQATLLG